MASGAFKAFVYGYGYDLPDITAASLGLFLLLAILAVKHLASRLREVPRPWVEAATWLVVTVIVYSATAFYTPSNEYAYVKIALLWAVLLYYLCALSVHPGDLSRTLRLLLWATIAMCVGYFPIAEDLAMRQGGFAQTEALLSLYLVLGFLCGFCMIIVAFGYANLSKAWTIVLGILFFAALVGTGARGPLIALLVSAAIAWLMRLLQEPRSMGSRLMVMGIGSGVVALGLFLLMTVSSDPTGGIQFLLDRSASRLSAFADLSSSRSFGERFDHLAFIVERFQAAPQRLFAGFGIGSYGVTRYGIDAPAHPHNILMEVLYEGGLLSLLALGLFLWVACKGLMRNHGAAGLALWTYFVLNAMKSSSIVEQRIMIVAISLFLACVLSRGAKVHNETT